MDVEPQRFALHLELRAEDGLEARRRGRLHELDRAVQVAPVGQGNRRQFVALGQINDGLDGERGVEEGIIAIDGQGDGRW